MAAAAVSLSADEEESCVLCTTKYNRTRPSFCQCKHCSIPLCLDCMKEHHDEVLQNVTHISHQYNQLQELLQTKQATIVDETAKFIENVNRYFDTYINELRETQHKIIADLETAQQDAQVMREIQRIIYQYLYFLEPCAEYKIRFIYTGY
jgi:hypothetical protein